MPWRRIAVRGEYLMERAADAEGTCRGRGER